MTIDELIEKLNNVKADIDTNVQHSEFLVDCVDIIKNELKIEDKKACLIFDYAWQLGHHNGYIEVCVYLQELIDLIKKVLK